MQQNQTGKTKTAMLLELESIKDLLVEEDDIPILQEVVQQLITSQEPSVSLLEPADTLSASEDNGNSRQDEQDTSPQSIVAIQPEAPLAEPALAANSETGNFTLIPEETSTQTTVPPSPAIPLETSPTHYREEQQQDFFPQSLEQDISAPPAENKSQNIEAPTTPANVKTGSSRITPQKVSGQNPFLPEHIRARLQGNNPTSLTVENQVRNSKHNFTTTTVSEKKSNSQQQLINEIIDKMMPEIAKELRGRLEQMSREVLAELLAEHKR